VHTFDDALASHLNDGAGAAVPKATVPRFNVGHGTSNMGRRRRSYEKKKAKKWWGNNKDYAQVVCRREQW
jgi:hypothetical protein